MNREPTRVHLTFRTAGAGMLALGLIFAAVGFFSAGSNVKELAHSYLFGWTYWACLTFGCLGLTLLHHTGRGHWGFPVLRILEAGGGPVNIIVTGLSFVPVALLWRASLYPWANPEMVAADKVLRYRQPYMSDGMWLFRYVLFFAILTFFAWRFKSWTSLEEKTGEDKWWKIRQYWGGAALVVFVLCMNFMWTDWTMSLYPHWYSTMYGFWFVAGSALLAFALVAVILGTQADRSPYDRVVNPVLTKDIGNWMLTFTMLWAYFSLSQYLIQWSGNLPEFIEYWLDRSRDVGWWLWGIMLIPLHFFLPFLLLLSPRMKRVPRLLAAVGFVILFVRLLDVAYVILPTWKPSLAMLNALDLGMFLLFGGVWCVVFGLQIAQAPLLTYLRPSLKEAAESV